MYTKQSMYIADPAGIKPTVDIELTHTFEYIPTEVTMKGETKTEETIKKTVSVRIGGIGLTKHQVVTLMQLLDTIYL